MKILITGASGFLGEKLIERLYEGNELVCVCRNEGKPISLKNKFPNIEVFFGDIANKWFIAKVFQEYGYFDEVYHLAAFKHVVEAETQSIQCISTNVLGTANLLEAVFIFKPKFIIGISTDKAAQVSGVYGATKLLMEKMFEEFEKINPETTYRIVRYGNVLYSTGSVLCKWKERMTEGKEVEITDPEMTRFFWTREQAINHIFLCKSKAKNAKPFVPEMKAIRMGDLLEVMMEKYGKVKVITKGAQPGDNMHETMDGKVFSNQVEKYTKEEIKKLI